MSQRFERQLLTLAARVGRLPVAERQAFLETQLGDDPDRIEQARALVQLLEEATSAADSTTASPSGLIGPPKLPGFELLELIGHGGMGCVFRARQLKPERDVAIKLIRADLMSPEARTRLAREADLLGRLNHPAIARVFAAGTADDGQPWLAMELIEGQMLQLYLADGQHPDRDIVSLIARIADGVAHAHQQGVIHRDLKPANVLVDASGQPHILDFGVARLTEIDAAQASTLVQAGELVGTLGYMAPEQIDGRADTRSDVYALGVMLYRALARTMPIDLKGLSLIDAIGRLTREQPVSLKRYRADLDPELEALVMHALAPNPDDRYGSMAQFREDLERYLTNRPILARAPGRWRAFGLFVRRHRLGVASAALLSLAILTGTAVSLHFGYREAQARSQAELRSEQLAAVNQFIHDTLTAADPDNTLGEQVTLVETLTEAARLLPLDQGMDPPVRAELHRLIGSILLNLGRSEEGSVQLSHAADLYGQVSDPTLDDVWLTRIEQARAALESGHIDEALDITDSLSPDIGQLAAGAHVRNYWAAIRGRALLESGRLDDAEVLVEHHLSEAEDELGPNAEDTLVLKNHLAIIAGRRGDPARELALSEELLAGRIAQFGPDHPQTLSAMNNLASALSNSGQTESAEALARETLAKRRRVLGDDHPSTIVTRNNLAALLIMLGQPAVAEPEVRHVLSWNERRLGSRHPNTLAARNILAYLLEDQGELDEAETLYRQIIAEVRESGDDGLRAQMLAVGNNLGMLLLNRGQAAAAVKEFEALLSETEVLLGRDHLSYAVFGANYAWCLASAGRAGEAAPMMQRSLEQLEAALGPDHPRVVQVRERLASVINGGGAMLNAAPDSDS